MSQWNYKRVIRIGISLDINTHELEQFDVGEERSCFVEFLWQLAFVNDYVILEDAEDAWFLDDAESKGEGIIDSCVFIDDPALLINHY